MTRVTLTRCLEGSGLHHGRWRPVLLDGERTARIACPSCGTLGLLDHEIAEDGAVSPSVVCPRDGCGWHEWIRQSTEER